MQVSHRSVVPDGLVSVISVITRQLRDYAEAYVTRKVYRS
jgi:hypothetical protein